MENRASVIKKVSEYVTRIYGDDSEESFQKMFKLINMDHDDKCSVDEICKLLGYAGAGFLITRPAIAKEILDLLDTDNDGKVSWSEFVNVFRSSK